MQTSVIYLLYLLVEIDKQGAFFDYLTSISILENHTLFIIANKNLIIFLIAFLILIIHSIVKYNGDLQLLKLTYKIYLKDAHRILNSYLFTDLSILDTIGSERITSNLINDSGAIVSILRDYIIIFGAMIMLTVYLIICSIISPGITISALFIAIIPLIINKNFYKTLRTVGELKVSSNERVIKFFTDFTNGFKRIKLDALEEKFNKLSRPVLNKSQEWRILKRKITSKVEILTSNSSVFSVLLIIFLGISIFSLSLPSLMILLVVFSQMRGSITAISIHYGRFKETQPNVLRYFDLLDTLGKDKKKLNKLLNLVPKQIEMSNVIFKYDNKNILNNISFSATEGDRILIQGASGHGKSTFLTLLAGLRQPNEGHISYNNNILNEELLFSIRNNSIYISPEIYLFNQTIRENLSLGFNVTDKDIDRAISNSFLNEVVDNLPKGLDSKIGINGDALSLGQRQRLILSRLFLRKPQLILLDEPTANLNPKLETNILQNIYSYIEERAILIIVAHKEPNNISFTHNYNIYNGNLK